ncbi:SusC/RagA family protein [Niastella vici]|uniref:SusC/RagA family protein n=1 Tax=Niastella vici TaxID=1703345 RepID=A0A1V9FJ02_9BACT|nr:SusC/RagA family TonB-linked outer membrane protein [Niastella vici]OQP58257.1 SusC/RagA family protein [Niastella vici]
MYKKVPEKSYCPGGKSIKTILCLLLLLSASAQLMAGSRHAKKRQNVLDRIISIELKNVVLKDALDRIGNTAKVFFVHTNNEILLRNKVSISAQKQTVGDVLKKLLGPYALSFIVVDDRIIVRPENNLPVRQVFAAPGEPAQTTNDISVKGVVTSEKGAPLAGVSIIIRGTSRGVATNEKGEFELKNISSDAVLVFTVTGYATEEIRVSNYKNGFIQIKLKEEATNMEGVVVTGYQNVDKKKFAGSAVRVKMDDIKMDGTTDVSRMLEGRAAGVSVQNVSGVFGAAPKVRIRGATSINGDNKPLWVVDGVVLEDIVNISNDQLSSGDPTTLLGSAVAGLNANDIESFDILKDAAATALYGARAMNGVVVITTKKGRVGKTAVNYTGNYSTQFKPTYNDYNIMNSAQQLSVLAELERKGILTTDLLDRSDIGVYGKMYEELSTVNPDGSFALKNTPAAKRAFLLRYGKANTDWFDLLFRNNFMQEHSLAISSGTDKTQSYFSTSYYGDNGWTVADKVSRYTLNYRNNYKFNDRLSGGFATVGSVRQQKAPGSLSRSGNPVEGKYDRDFDINPFSYALNTSRTLTAYDDKGNLEYFRRNFAPFNILSELKNNYLDLNIIDLRLQGNLEYKFAKNFRYEFVGAMRYVKSTREHQITEKSNMANAYRAAQTSTIRSANKFLYTNPDDPEAQPVVVLPYGGFYNRAEDALVNFDIRNSLNYTKTISGKHFINALVGQQVKYADRQHFSNTGYGYQYENGGVPFIDYRILKQTIETNFPYYEMSKEYDRFVALYASGQYTYDSKYNFTATVRYDGSNRMGKSPTARWLPTWSVAGSWNVDREGFMQDIRFVDYLTVRGTYGLTASMGPATNSSIVLKNVNTNRPYSNEVESVIQLTNLENSDLTWEKLYTTNLGIDAGFLNKRMNVSLDVFQRRSFDLINTVKTSGIGGEAYKQANNADMDSKGLELLVGGEVFKRKDWGWKTTLTFGYNTNKITRAKNIPNIFNLVSAEGGNKEGYPVRSLFSIKYKGLQPFNGYPLFVDEDGKTSSTVYMQSESTGNLQYEGPVDPTITGGFSNTFYYKAFSLNVFITYQAGNTIRLYPAFKTSYSDLDAMPKEFYDRWTMPGDEKYTNVPSILDAFAQSQLGGAYPYNNYNYSTQRVAKGDLIRLKTVSLSYQLPGVKKFGLNNASVTAAATNPWLIYSDEKLRGQDPEFFNSGGVAQPIQKQITLALKVGL